MTVAPGSGAAAPLPDTVAPQLQTQPQTQATVNDHAAQKSVVDVVSGVATSAGWWPWLSLALGLAWLITVIAWRRQYQRQRRTPVVQSTTSNTTADQQRLRSLEQQLKKACQQNDAQQSKAVLLEWAKARWPQQPLVSLTAIARLSQPELADAITALDRALYANGESGWQGGRLWQLFERHKLAEIKVVSESGEALEPLYRA